MGRKIRIFLVGLLVLAYCKYSSQIDLALSGYFYQGSGHFTEHPVLRFIYNVFVAPAYICGFIGLILLILSWFRPSIRICRSSAWVAFLTLVLGVGLIVNVVFKDHYGRPRPREIERFGGSDNYAPFYHAHWKLSSQGCRSFPCGHSSMGFYFFALARIAQRKRNRQWTQWMSMTAWLLGGLLGLTRIAQGGHFLSDVVASAAVMWGMAYLVDALVFENWRSLLYPSERYERTHSSSAPGSTVY